MNHKSKYTTSENYVLHTDDIVYEDEDHVVLAKDQDIAGNLKVPVFLLELGILLNEKEEGFLWCLNEMDRKDFIKKWIKQLNKLLENA